jgi:hypothetical protein
MPIHGTPGKDHTFTPAMSRDDATLTIPVHLALGLFRLQLTRAHERNRSLDMRNRPNQALAKLSAGLGASTSG